MSVPNQRLLSFDREKVNTKQTQRPYLLVYMDNINFVYKLLKGEKTFGLYLYFLEQIPHSYNNQKSDKCPPLYELSSEAIEKELGISNSTYKRSIDKLIELGFLVHVQGNRYIFYEMPKQYRVKTYEEFVQEQEITEMLQKEKTREEKEQELLKQARDKGYDWV